MPCIYIRKEAGRILGEDDGHKKAVETIYGWISNTKEIIKGKMVRQKKQMIKMTKGVIAGMEETGRVQALEEAQNIINELGTCFLPDHVVQSTILEEDTPKKVLTQPELQFEYPTGSGFEMPKGIPIVLPPKPALSQKERRKLEKEAKAKKEQEDEIAFIKELKAQQAGMEFPTKDSTKK